MATKARNMVGLSYLVLTRGIPDEVRLKDHSLDFIGGDSSGDFVTGVNGTHSKQMALVAGARWTREHEGRPGNNRILILDVNYLVDNYSLTREQTRPDSLKKTGWLHLDRVAADFREEIKEEWLQWIRKDFSVEAAEIAQNDSLPDIALKYPKYIKKMMRANADIRGVVHPVYPTIDPSICLWVATTRYEKERFDAPVMRYLPQVTVKI
jgi:hypothetical protein